MPNHEAWRFMCHHVSHPSTRAKMGEMRRQRAMQTMRRLANRGARSA